MKPADFYLALTASLKRLRNNKATEKIRRLIKPQKPQPMTLAEIVELQQEVIASLTDELNRLTDKLEKQQFTS